MNYKMWKCPDDNSRELTRPLCGWLSTWNCCILLGDLYIHYLNIIHLSFPFPLLNAHPFHMNTEWKTMIFFSWKRTTFFSFCYQLLINSIWWVLLLFFGLGQLNLSFNFLLLDLNVYVPKNDTGESFRLNPFFSIRTWALRRLKYK